MAKIEVIRVEPKVIVEFSETEFRAMRAALFDTVHNRSAMMLGALGEPATLLYKQLATVGV